MNMLTTSLFALSGPNTIGVGYHNVGSGCHFADQPAQVQKVEGLYGQRCGHLPLEAERVHVLVAAPTAEIEAQWAYLSRLMGKPITALSPQDLVIALRKAADATTLVVPYINVPETEHWIQEELGAPSWGLAGKMVHLLKNKAAFYQLLDDLQLEGVAVPEYTIAPLAAVPQVGLRLLATIEELISQAGVSSYPVGVMLRGAESDGHYGCCLVYEHQQRVLIIPDGNVQQARCVPTWQHALTVAQQHLAAGMNVEKESRVVISRFLDVADSPGLSVVLMGGQVFPLGWNGQQQAPGSTACVGTSPYQPKNVTLAHMQQATEAQTAACFETLLRQTAHQCGLDFACLRGVANLDFMLPGPREQQLQHNLGRSPAVYLAECNPRWTNYTDALLTVLAVKRQTATISALRSAIQEGLATIDSYPLPPLVEPERVRDELLRRHESLSQAGISIICRMTHDPMGFIFAGPVKQAQQEVAHLLDRLTTTTTWAGACAQRPDRTAGKGERDDDARMGYACTNCQKADGAQQKNDYRHTPASFPDYNMRWNQNPCNNRS
jgi:hypothetical protein